jgi:hypothetical protein
MHDTLEPMCFLHERWSLHELATLLWLRLCQQARDSRERAVQEVLYHVDLIISLLLTCQGANGVAYKLNVICGCHVGSAGLGLEWYIYFLPWGLEKIMSPRVPTHSYSACHPSRGYRATCGLRSKKHLCWEQGVRRPGVCSRSSRVLCPLELI